MTRLQIKIKENDVITVSKDKNSLEDLFGLWENREISFHELREKAWIRHNDTL